MTVAPQWEKAAFLKLARLGAIVFLPTKDDKYLLQVADPDDESKPGQLRPPGGGKDTKDKNLTETVIREIHEEFAIPKAEVRKKVKFLGYEYRDKFWGNAVFEMRGHGLHPGVYQASNDPDEKVRLVEASLDSKKYVGPDPARLITEEAKEYGEKLEKESSVGMVGAALQKLSDFSRKAGVADVEKFLGCVYDFSKRSAMLSAQSEQGGQLGIDGRVRQETPVGFSAENVLHTGDGDLAGNCEIDGAKTSSAKVAKQNNLVISDPGISMPFSEAVSLFSNTVVIVDLLSSLEKVAGVHANRIVAGVQNEKTGVASVMDLPDNSRSTKVAQASTQIESGVSVFRIAGALPDPATVFAGLVNLAPELGDFCRSQFSNGTNEAFHKLSAKRMDDVTDKFKPDFTPDDMEEKGQVSDRLQHKIKLRLASMAVWPAEWTTADDPEGWIAWYRQYHGGRRTANDDRQIKRWLSFKSRNEAQFTNHPTPRRAWSLVNWAIDPVALLPKEDQEEFRAQMEDYKERIDARAKSATTVLPPYEAGQMIARSIADSDQHPGLPMAFNADSERAEEWVNSVSNNESDVYLEDMARRFQTRKSGFSGVIALAEEFGEPLWSKSATQLPEDPNRITMSKLRKLTSNPLPKEPGVQPLDAHGAPLTGPEAIHFALQNLDLDEKQRDAMGIVTRKLKSKRPDAVKVLGYIDGLNRTGYKPDELMLTRIPVIPPNFRPFSVAGDTFVPGDVNELYRDLINLVGVHKELEGKLGAGAAFNKLNVYDAVSALYGFGDPTSPKTRERGVSGFLKKVTGVNPKFSFAQRKLLSKDMDYVARGVIGVDPELGLDQIGIPDNVLWTLYSPYVQRSLVRSGMSAEQSLRAIRDKTEAASRMLDRELKDRPVVYSRSPSWHKFNVIAGYAKRSPGDMIRVNPLVTTGLNADFDGDQCINQILVYITSSLISELGMSYPKLLSHEVRFSEAGSIPVLNEGRIFIFDLEDFPHGPLLRSKQGAKGQIDFHSVPEGIKVLAHDLDTGGLCWAQVAAWSKHYARQIEIVDTHNGFQIVTDDDPRAVYGVAAGSDVAGRFTPSDALLKKVLIPRARYIPSPDVVVNEIEGCNDSKFRLSHRMPDLISLDSDTGWVIGAMCGDGWVIQSRGNIRGFAFADNDGFNIAALKERTQKLLVPGTQLNYHSVESSSGEAGRYGDTTSYRFSAVNMGRWFRDLIGGEGDETTAGSANKHLPAFWMSTSVEFRSGLFSGLMDTDGSISVSNGKSKPQLMSAFSSTSIRLVQETKLLAASLGIYGRITPSTTPKGKPFWMLSFSNTDIQKWGGGGMVHEHKLSQLKSVPKIIPSPATAKYDIVPITEWLANKLAQQIGYPKLSKSDRAGGGDAVLRKKRLQALYMPLAQARNSGHEKYGALSRQHAVAVINYLGAEVISKLAGGEHWMKTVAADDLSWERVVAVQKTGIKEDGYDLTVPGYETFMAADGVILSNTINVHLPSLPEAVQESKDKLMPSRMLFSIKDRNKVMPTPKQEFIMGLYNAQRRPAKKTVDFPDEASALAAIKTGQVAMSDEITIKGKI